ncbi:universal stress protein [Rhizobium alvei]|uniref:Universal stress protein n=1 Tax=Rhizobium alvei TaxID=1132659 RepID=A0ABT8YGJ7_9HYPH|nr:universal stress protein [Rhizobium alvei]MDO6962706.1 universal stress protein [Rhizobium alvei]
MYKKIIVPVDMGQLEKGAKILSKAKALLDEGGEIILLNIAEAVPGYLAIDLPVDFIENAVKDADVKLKELNQTCGTEAKIQVRVGSSAREILAAAEDLGADLIIIASHRPDFSNYLLGATADRVVRHAKCSVLVDR